MAKKKPTSNLPKRVKPGDMVPGGFGARTLKGVGGALRGVRQGMPKPKSPKKPK